MSAKTTGSEGAPLIGITGPRLHAAEVSTTPSILLHTWVDCHYVFCPRAVASAGGLPVHLPRESDPVEMVSRLDGLVVAGGHDVDPRVYGRQPTATTSRLDPGRDAFELKLIEAAFEARLPLLGICRGAQLMNIVCGGTLIDDLVPVQKVEHTLILYPPEARIHEVTCEGGSRLHRVYGDRISVNSYHHQGIDELGSGVQVSGLASDGTVEAIEIEAQPALGVQWHPEMLGSDPIFDWLVKLSTDDVTPARRPERSTAWQR